MKPARRALRATALLAFVWPIHGEATTQAAESSVDRAKKG